MKPEKFSSYVTQRNYLDVRDTGEWITEELRDYAQRKGEPWLQFSQGLA